MVGNIEDGAFKRWGKTGFLNMVRWWAYYVQIAFFYICHHALLVLLSYSYRLNENICYQPVVYSGLLYLANRDYFSQTQPPPAICQWVY